MRGGRGVSRGLNYMCMEMIRGRCFRWGSGEGRVLGLVSWVCCRNI